MVKVKNIDGFFKKTLFLKPDTNGESIYYIDKQLKEPYTGILIETKANDTIIWWSEYIDGVQNGVEKNYDFDGILEQVSECKYNMHVGVSKEYDKLGNLTYVAIKWNNGPIRAIFFDSNMQIINKEEDERWLRNFPIPDDLRRLLELTDEELINYKFQYTLWRE